MLLAEIRLFHRIGAGGDGGGGSRVFTTHTKEGLWYGKMIYL